MRKKIAEFIDNHPRTATVISIGAALFVGAAYAKHGAERDNRVNSVTLWNDGPAQLVVVKKNNGKIQTFTRTIGQ